MIADFSHFLWARCCEGYCHSEHCGAYC